MSGNIIKEKGCRDCGNSYGCWEIVTARQSLDNDCERCNEEYKKENCKLIGIKDPLIIVGQCPTCRKS